MIETISDTMGRGHQPLTDDDNTLYRHQRRAEWGLAILAWEQPTKRGYQFQDGELRIIKQGFYSLLHTVDPPPDDAPEVVAHLRHRAGLAGANGQPGSRPADRGLAFSDQVRIFRAEYPEGFTDEAWLARTRGVDAGRRLKRHRQAAIDEARKTLGDEQLQQALATEQCTAIVEAALDVLGKTNLVRSQDLEPISRLTPDQHPQYVAGLRELLYGDTAEHQRFDRYAVLHGRKASWPAATALAALVQPDAAICIHPAVMRRQARALDPTLRLGNEPDGRTYERCLALTRRLRDLLAKESLPPTDLMDVFDFMSMTLRPSAGKVLTSGDVPTTA